MRSLAAAVIVASTVLAAPLAFAERPRLEYVPAKIDPNRNVGMVVNSKTIFLNKCTGGCKVYSGFTDSRTNKSSIGQGTLSAFEHGASSWSQVMSCVQDVFDRFNVTITDVDPGPTTDHFEIMVAGTPTQIGLSPGIGGIAEYSCTSPGVCSKYLPDALVFAFANYYPNDPDEICAVVAQEIAHTWSLDHVSDPSDPMTYYSYSGRRQFKDGVQCGSDCVNGSSPFGLTCSGNNHTCMSTGTNTQNDVQILMALFGPAGAVAPTIKLKNPIEGAAVGPGFTVEAECTSTRPIQEVQLSVDGLLKATLTAPPFTFTTSTSLTEGPHKVTVLCATDQQAIATASANVTLGNPCTGDSQCQTGYICFDGACIAGPDAPGGVGATCGGNMDCKSGACASDGTTNACVIPCDLDAKNCPSGFGCLQAGEVGVCWSGYDDGSGGCCDAGGSGPASMLLSLGLGGVLLRTRRRRRNRR